MTTLEQIKQTSREIREISSKLATKGDYAKAVVVLAVVWAVAIWALLMVVLLRGGFP